MLFYQLLLPMPLDMAQLRFRKYSVAEIPFVEDCKRVIPTEVLSSMSPPPTMHDIVFSTLAGDIGDKGEAFLQTLWNLEQ